MRSHKDLILTMVSAAREGEDFAAIFQSGRDHLLSCEHCRQAALALLGDVLGEEELLLLLAEEVESDSPLPKPSAYPSFDFSFLDRSEPEIWTSSSEVMEPLEKGEESGRVSKLAKKTYVLRYAVEILLGQKEARLGELSAALQPFQFAPVPVRGEREQRPEGLTLEDAEHDMRITLRLSGQHQLSIRLYSGSAARPGRLALISTDEPKRTLQRLSLRTDEETSLPLTRGDLVVQVEHDQQTWEIPIRVR